MQRMTETSPGEKMKNRPEEIPERILEAFGLKSPRITRITQGLINRTWKVELPERTLVIQWLNPIFGPENLEDLETITQRLDSSGLRTPHLVHCEDGSTYQQGSSGLWRALSWIEGRCFDEVDSEKRAFEAGGILGRFHGALWDFSYSFQSQRPQIHGLDRHLKGLRLALEEYSKHRKLREVSRIASSIFETAEKLAKVPRVPRRILHGDPKISNILFDNQDRAICLIDLDSLGHGFLSDELGDAFRSWCKSGGEDEEFDFLIPHYNSSLNGYLNGLGPHRASRKEVLSFPEATQRISLELAARFARDALTESYFGWDPLHYESAAEHNLARAGSQLALSRSIASRLPELQAITRRALRDYQLN